MSMKRESKIFILILSLVGFFVITVAVLSVLFVPKLIDTFKQVNGNFDQAMNKNGGIYAELSPSTSDKAIITSKLLALEKKVLEKRMNNSGILYKYEEVTNNNEIILQIARKTGENNNDLRREINKVTQTALVTFREVDENKKDTNGNYLPLEDKIILQNDDITNAGVDTNLQTGMIEVTLTFSQEGTKKFAEATRRLAPVHGVVAIFMDDQLISSPQVDEEIPDGRANISGNFTATEAKDLADTIKSGALPFKLKMLKMEFKAPTSK